MSKINIILGSVGIISIITLFALWRASSVAATQKEKDLQAAYLKIEVLNNDKEKLIEYTVKKENELYALDKKYKETLLHIPSDICGDAKPSAELLAFLKGNTR